MTRLTEAYLRRYLLRELPESEQTEVETELFTEESAAEQLCVVEDELIDAYVRDELSPRERTVFETTFVNSGRIAGRIQVAEALLLRAAESTERAPVSGRSWRYVLADLARLPYARPLAALALGVICAISSLVSSFVSSNLIRRELARSATHTNEAFRREISDREREWKQAMNDLLARQSSAAPDYSRPAVTPPAATLLSFVLTPGAFRSAGNAQRILLPRGPATVKLDLSIRDDQKYRTYRAVMRDAEQNQIWSGTLEGSRVTNPHLVEFTMPLNVMNPGEYGIELAADTGSGVFDVLENYFFSIVRK